MKKLFLIICFFAFSVFCSGESALNQEILDARQRLRIAAPENREDKTPLIMVHYMPWFEAMPEKKLYGFHWSMGGKVFNPFKTDADGKANIASHYYPLTGPYDSRNMDLLEYQAQLMKIAGIHGVIIDWYGINDCWDYSFIHDATAKMIEVCKKAGLKYAICYEDQTIRQLIQTNKISAKQDVKTARNVFAWLQKNWFMDENYLKFEGRPVVLCFGPQYFKEASQWEKIFARMKVRPYLVALDNQGKNFADGSFCWPPMSRNINGVLSFSSLVTYLNGFYESQRQKKYLVTSAFPRFHDIYKEAGSGNSYGYLDYADGETLKLTMEAALQAKADVIQIVTWNDYGEGTVIEPTYEHGYKDLEYIQSVRKRIDPSFSFTAEDLRLPLANYKEKRKK